MRKFLVNEEGRECASPLHEGKRFLTWDNFHAHKSGANGKNSKCTVCRRKIHLKHEKKKLKTGNVPKPKSLQSQCQKTWDANGAAAFLTRK